jgi:multidrug efflux system membrane fusion protein
MCWARSTRTAICLVVFAALASGCAKQQAAPPERPPTIVTVAKVTQKTMPVVVTAVGNVEAISTISIRAQVAGEVQNIRFKEGDFVKKGQVLLTIDPRPYEAALAQAKAALARDKATGTYNRAQAQRYKTLFDQGVVPAEQVDSFRGRLGCRCECRRGRREDGGAQSGILHDRIAA